MIILHGENTTQSRNRLVEILQEARAQHKNITRVDAKQLELRALEVLLGSENLFGETRLLIFDELHSLPKSKRKDELITMLGAATGQDIVLWEKRQLAPTMLKKFSGARAEEFKLTNALFKWLDSLSGDRQSAPQMLKLLGQAILSDGDFMCFTMLIRQIRLLIIAKDGGKIAGAPFMIAKLKKQSSVFSIEQLLRLHHKLLEMDIAQKTSQSRLGLPRELELFIVTM